MVGEARGKFKVSSFKFQVEGTNRQSQAHFNPEILNLQVDVRHWLPF